MDEAATRPASAYPLRHRGGDHRFTLGLVHDIAAVLTRHGYPALATGNDLLRWQNALYDIIYRTKGTP